MTRGPLWSLVVGSALACSGGPHTVRPLSSDRDVVLKPAPEADLVYLVMVDRFANGDHGNDVGIDLSDPHGWHGGDLRGVLDRLDHLEALGVKTVWLTPVTAARDEKVGEWGAFHGYWLSDPRRMNPRFGTIADLRALSDALHARGMRLVVDMVWNHTDYDAPVRQSHPEWFHTLGDIQDWDDPLQRVRGDVHGLPDLAQENPKVREWLRGSATAWVDRAGLDGLRIDAVGHMPRSFLAHMNRELDAHARKRGNPEGVWTLAEDFTGDPLALAETVEKTLSSTLLSTTRSSTSPAAAPTHSAWHPRSRSTATDRPPALASPSSTTTTCPAWHRSATPAPPPDKPAGTQPCCCSSPFGGPPA